MDALMTFLYIIGYLLVAVSVFIAVPVSSRAIRKMETEAAGLWGWKREWEARELAALDRDSLGEARYAEEVLRIDAAATRAMKDRAKRLDIPFEAGIAVSRARTDEVASAIRRVGRANVPTAILALVGGLSSTVASVISVWA